MIFQQFLQVDSKCWSFAWFQATDEKEGGGGNAEKLKC
jgi:hypothetical protein